MTKRKHHKSRRPEIRARAQAIHAERRAHSLNLLYGEGFLAGVSGGAPPDHEIHFYGSKRAADDQYTAGFMVGRRIRKERQAAAASS